MADFQLYLPKLEQIEGGFQDHPEDLGNYNSRGELVGTNHGISAVAYEDFLGYPPSREDMLAMSSDVAQSIFKTVFWDGVKGDEINSQAIAEIVADAKINQTMASVRLWQTVLNNAGQTLVVDGAFGPKTLKATNRVSESVGFNDMFDAREIYYNYRGGDWDRVPSDWWALFESWGISSATQSEFLQGWLNRLYDFFPKLPETVADVQSAPDVWDIDPVALNEKKNCRCIPAISWLDQWY